MLKFNLKKRPAIQLQVKLSLEAQSNCKERSGINYQLLIINYQLSPEAQPNCMERCGINYQLFQTPYHFLRFHPSVKIFCTNITQSNSLIFQCCSVLMRRLRNFGRFIITNLSVQCSY